MKTLREWRTSRLLGTQALADRSGVTKTTIIQLEHGRQAPKFQTIQRLSDALGVEAMDVTEFAAAIEARAAAPAVNAEIQRPR